jgi:uncharacterized protein YjeT (DUF2065 family)
MDLLAALALVLILEGLALAIFARSMPQLLAEIERLGPGSLRRAGLVCIGLGTALYIMVRLG